MMATTNVSFYLLILSYCIWYSYGSLVTNQGYDFVIGFSAQHALYPANGTNRIYLTSETMATVRIRAPAVSMDTNIQLYPGTPHHVDLPGKARMKSSTGIEKKGIQLTSSDKFTVYGMNLLTKSSDGFLGLPVSALGTDYVISTVVPVISSVLLVVATKDATMVNVKLKITSGGWVSYNNIQYSNSDSIVVKLNALEGFQIVTKSMEDITGTRVSSDKPVSVFSGCDCAYVPVNKISCDHLVEQILPVKLLGTQFITIATANRTGGDLYHVIAAHNGTIVTVDKKVVTTIQAGQRYELDSKSNEYHVISTSKPSLVMQYGKSFSVDGSIFDPFMSTVPAINQYSSDYTVFIPVHLSNKLFVTYVSIVVKTKDLDKITIMKNRDYGLTMKFTDCSAVPGASYSVCTKRLTKGFYQIYHHSITERFALVTYGTLHRETFGFPVGLRFESPGCKPGNMTPGDGFDNDCDGRFDEEVYNDIDDDGDGRVDEDLISRPPLLTVPANVTRVICNNSLFDPKKMIGQAIGEADRKCVLRGPVNITSSDTIDRTACYLNIVRKWTATDGCANIKEANQYFFIKFPSKPVLEFPKDLTMICRAKNDLSPTYTGKAKVIDDACNAVQVRYQDSMYYPCFLTERTLERNWIVNDECGRQTTHKQTIRLLPLDSTQHTRNFNVSMILNANVIRQNNETVVQSEARVIKQVDKAIMFSPIAVSYVGSSMLKYRSLSTKPVAIVIVKFQKTSTIMPDDILTSLGLAYVRGILANVVNSTKDITVQDFNECKISGYTNCGKNAACNNTVGSFNCTCLPGFVGDGFKCHAPPTITYITPYTEAGVGENVTIRCDVHGIPEPKVSWKTSTGRILDKDVGLRDVETLDDGTRRIRLKQQQEDNSLVITDAQVDDSGIYTCMAKNSFGQIRKVANFTVRKDRVAVHASVTLVEETFTDDLKNRTSLRFLTLENQLITKLSALFKIIPGFQKVEILQFVKGSVKALIRVVVKGDASRASRHQKSVEQEVGELLKNEVSSGYIGKLKVKKTAKLQERPPAPVNLQSSDIKHSSVKVNWDPPSLHTMYGVFIYSVQYKEFGSNVNIWRMASVTSLTHTLTKLKPGASYMVRAKSNNDYGASEPSDVLEITTLKEKSTTEWLVLILIPILLIIIVIFVIICIVRIIRKKGKYDPTATEEIGMIRLQSTPQSRQSRPPRRSWRPFQSKKFTLDHGEGANDGHYTGNPMHIRKIKRTSETEERLLLEPGDQHSWQEISRDQITLGDVLGEGEFGKVYKGIVTDSSGKEMTCAVKSLKSTATETDLKDLLNELEIMASVGHHNNVIGLIGVCAAGGPLLAVVEYAEHGNLLHYLRRHRRQNYDNMADYTVDISAADRLKFACEISKGMSHLARMKCVHRDLAARNVLLGESLVAKVSDFGLSRDVYTDNVYEKKTAGKLPARWMALESLEIGMYSSQSDVWSFGVVLWEIETGGATPFASYSVAEIMEHFKAGRRLGRPTDCNRHLYTMMLRCWNSNPDKRPTFDTLTHELKQLYQQETMYVNIGHNVEDTNGNQKRPSTTSEEC